MEISKGNSLCCYTCISNKQKYHFFSFFLYKMREQESRTSSEGGWYQWEGGGDRERAGGEYAANTVYTYM
jgi:hypothetical protein